MSRVHSQRSPAAREELNAAVSPRSSGFHAAREEQQLSGLDLGRALKAHRRTAISIVALGLIVTFAYLWKFWPVYSAEAMVFIQPAPAIESASGTVMRWPYNYDPATYDSYLQQQMLSMKSSEVLQSALSMLRNFQRSSESDQDALDRLEKSISAGHIGKTYEVAVRAQADNAQLAAELANAVSVSYVQNTARERQASDAERIALMRAEAERVKSQLDEDRAELAIGATQDTRRTADLNAEIARLQSRFNELDVRIQNLSIEDAAPGMAHVTTTATPPTHPVADGVIPRAAVMLAGFLLMAVAAALLAQKLDQRVNSSADVERLVGFPPVVELPDFNEVSQAVFEEQVLRLSAAVEAVLAKDRLVSCVFTGAGVANGVSTIVMRIRELIEGMGRTVTLLEAAGGRAAVWPGSRTAVDAAFDGARPLALMQKLAEEAGMHGGGAILADAAPLRVSAETEYLVRNADCVIVVVESGVTTRRELLATAKALQTLDVAVVGYALNQVPLANADENFRESLAAIEDHVRLQNRVRKDEPVRTRRVEVRPVTESNLAATEVQEPRPQQEIPKTAEVSGSDPSVIAMPAPVSAITAEQKPAEEVARPAIIANSRFDQQSVDVPWWLADPVLKSSGAPRENISLSAVAVPVPNPGRKSASAPFAQPESRLSGLRKLFAEKNAEWAMRSTNPQPVEATPRVTQRGRMLVPEPQSKSPAAQPARMQETAVRRGTPEVMTVPEFLPPRKIAGARRDEDAASRRERRDTWDDVSVLPSWRGQYRRKE